MTSMIKEERKTHFAIRQVQKRVLESVVLETKAAGISNSEIAERCRIPESSVVRILRKYNKTS